MANTKGDQSFLSPFKLNPKTKKTPGGCGGPGEKKSETPKIKGKRKNKTAKKKKKKKKNRREVNLNEEKKGHVLELGRGVV